MTDRVRYYVLAGHEIKSVDSIQAWGEFFDDPEAGRVGIDDLDEATVSTVFLGINHNWLDEEGPPILFETMIFGGPHHQYWRRYATWDEAKAGHDAIVEALRAGKDPAAVR